MQSIKKYEELKVHNKYFTLLHSRSTEHFHIPNTQYCPYYYTYQSLIVINIIIFL
jgi:hypothetical protein